MKQLLRVNEQTLEVRTLYVTPCCGSKHYDFLDEPRTCFTCGRDLRDEPVSLERETDLTHLRFRPVTRYVS